MFIEHEARDRVSPRDQATHNQTENRLWKEKTLVVSIGFGLKDSSEPLGVGVKESVTGEVISRAATKNRGPDREMTEGGASQGLRRE